MGNGGMTTSRDRSVSAPATVARWGWVYLAAGLLGLGRVREHFPIRSGTRQLSAGTVTPQRWGAHGRGVRRPDASSHTTNNGSPRKRSDMTTNNVRSKTQSRLATWGWGILVAVSAVLILNGAGLFLFIADTQIFRTAAIVLAGLGLLALAITLDGFRHRTQHAWNSSWLLVAVLAVLAIHITVGGERDVAIWHAILAATALAGQLLAGTGKPR